MGSCGAAPDRRSSSPVLGLIASCISATDAADPQLRWSDCSRNIAADAALLTPSFFCSASSARSRSTTADGCLVLILSGCVGYLLQKAGYEPALSCSA